MRIKQIKASWFRGAAHEASLTLNTKSMLVYGPNGSGKSSFVDAVEYVLHDGRITHLAHEYAGKHQEKAIINTQIPAEARTGIAVTFADESELHVSVDRSGTFTRSGGDAAAMHTWDYHRTILRQDEVADFIKQTKGGKYSALLPLLGLDSLEIAAENIRRLIKQIDQTSRRHDLALELLALKLKRELIFGKKTDEEITSQVAGLYKAYCREASSPVSDVASQCGAILAAIEERLQKYSLDQQVHLAIQDIADSKVQAQIDAVREATSTVAGAVEPFLTERLEVLMPTGDYLDRLGSEEHVDCPACGRSIAVPDFKNHVAEEKQRLQLTISANETRKAALATLSDLVKTLKRTIHMEILDQWRRKHEPALKTQFEYLELLDAEALRKSCDEATLAQLEKHVGAIVKTAIEESALVPLDPKQLSTDRGVTEAAKLIWDSKSKESDRDQADDVAGYLKEVEEGIRNEIHDQSSSVLGAISTDVQTMWKILHEEPIEDVRLHIPTDTDKAIDIALKFYGDEQPSPRLTLSEGYRNSLGLCIFLAMAKQGVKGRPLFLDDVVISFDRNHRGMVATLLEEQFADSQVVLLTHDRDWYAELRHQLAQDRWQFGSLLPYETPRIGIRWSAKGDTFEEAKRRLDTAPDAAGNAARKIMDVELAIAAERLKLRMPYLHREHNDHRGAPEFLEAMISQGAKTFKEKRDGAYETNEAALAAFRRADALLVSWGNRDSHSFDSDKKEAKLLIEACETAIAALTCKNCGKYVYKADDERAEETQCGCDRLRWRYGKA